MNRAVPHLRSRSPGFAPGMSLVELIVVVALIATMFALLGAGFLAMQKGQKVSSGQTVVNSTLHYARSLAIANNATYHVRFENWDTDTNSPSEQQSISIYYFPNPADALTEVDGSTVKWNPYTHPYVPTNQTVPLNNVLVSRNPLPPKVYFGVQYLGASTPPQDKLIYFQNNGTTGLQSTLTLFVTDDPKFADDRNAGSYDDLQTQRRMFYNEGHSTRNQSGGTTHVRMTKVFLGGLIRDLTGTLEPQP